jgi:hypothetical protein
MPPVVVDPPPLRLRARVRQALVCPYCRDHVTREDAVACGRRGCGTLYHHECFEECLRSYGGCAVYGCRSQVTREVSRAGYVARVLRLFIAALFFPRRVVRALRRTETETLGSMVSRAWEGAKGWWPDSSVGCLVLMEPAVVLLWIALPLVWFVLSLTYYVARAVVFACRTELASLAWADGGVETTTIVRMSAPPPREKERT